MKKYFFLAAAALVAMCACTKTIVSEAPEVDQEICFQAATYSSATKASDKLINNTDFGVFAYIHSGNWAGVTTLTAYMNNVQVQHRTTPTDAWAPTSTYYWPKANKLSFAGYSPYSINNKVSYTKEYGITITDWEIVTAESATAATGNKIDLMWSNEDNSKNLTVDNADDAEHNGGTQQAYAHAGVPMLFHHALAQINLVFVYDGTKVTATQAASMPIKVTGAGLLQLNTKGTFNSTPASGATAWTTSVPSDVTLASSVVELTENTVDYKLGNQVDGTQSYFVIPQEATKLGINYTVNYSAIEAPAGETYAAKVDLGLPGTDGKNTITWEPNKIYTYTIKISPVTGVEILFDPAVDNWDTINPAGEFAF